MPAAAVRATGVLAHPRDAWLLGAATLHAGLFLVAPSPVVVGVLFWWTANTVAHNFIHNPFFSDRRANAVLSAALTLLQGVPQSLWRARHLAHHAGVDAELRRAPGLRREALLAGTWWCGLALFAPTFVLTVYAPGLLIGLGLSWL